MTHMQLLVLAVVALGVLVLAVAFTRGARHKADSGHGRTQAAMRTAQSAGRSNRTRSNPEPSTGGLSGAWFGGSSSGDSGSSDCGGGGGSSGCGGGGGGGGGGGD